MPGTSVTHRARAGLFVEAIGVVLAVVLLVPLAQAGGDDERIQSAAAAFRASNGAAPSVVEPLPETTVETAPAVAPPTTVRRPPATAATVRPSTTTSPARTVTTPAPLPRPTTAAILSTSTTAPSLSTSTTAPSPSTSTTAPAVAAATPTTTTTTTTVAPCRNSTDPSCGAFRFDPQPGADSPMTVQVVTEPASPQAGQEVVFRVTLTDPDGVSYGSSLFGFGDSGIGNTVLHDCAKYGAWDPPAVDPARAVEVQTLPHTYAKAGTYPTSFTFDAGPFDCTDSVTGRGDRPYASSAGATLTVVVTP